MKLTIINAVILSILLSSCSSQINGILREGGSAELTIQAALEPRMTSLIRTLSAMAGNSGPGLILDGPAISNSLAASAGVRSVSLVNTGPAALEGSAAVSKIDDFLGAGEVPFITYEEGTRPGSSHILISLNKSNAPHIVTLMSADVVDYLSALGAPIVMDEDLSKAEYLALVSSLYGRAIADEIREAMIHAAIDFPRPITSIRGGSAAGARALFEISLLDILVLETPLSWEISW